jgi:hypothetical protein
MLATRFSTAPAEMTRPAAIPRATGYPPAGGQKASLGLVPREIGN